MRQVCLYRLQVIIAVSLLHLLQAADAHMQLPEKQQMPPAATDSSRLRASLKVGVASQALCDDMLQLLNICHLQGGHGVMSAWHDVPVNVIDPRPFDSKP